jgi:class 3 adenylate cyclase
LRTPAAQNSVIQRFRHDGQLDAIFTHESGRAHSTVEGAQIVQPETRYARSGDVRIAFQVIGSGPINLVFVPGFISNLDNAWESPISAHFFSRLSSFSRLILFDKRGTGLSDRVSAIPTLEERMDDVRAVMDAAGSERAALFGISGGGAMCVLFAATYPERTQALVLYGTYSHFPTRMNEKLEEFLSVIEQSWGTGATLPYFAPTKASDPIMKEAWGRYERNGASPSAVISLMRMNSKIDVRHVLQAVRVPTLILHREGDTRVSVDAARYAARAIPNAKLLELPGIDHLIWVGNTEAVADAVAEFLTGSRADIDPDRVLATVLFTDIVDSTRRAAELGDRSWNTLLAQHDLIVRRELSRFHGQEHKALGDGFMATFDGPARAIRCAIAVVDAVRPLGIDVRSGLHTGEIELTNTDAKGITVHVAARIAGLAHGGEVLASRTVRDLVAGSNLHFSDRGLHRLKGLPKKVRLFAVGHEAHGYSANVSTGEPPRLTSRRGPLG